jgi:phospholipid/cholesterol/gamma-HCH transport system permease protein
MPSADAPVALAQMVAGRVLLSGPWTAHGIGATAHALEQLSAADATPPLRADASGINALDTVGAWVLQTLLQRLQRPGELIALDGLRPEFNALFESVVPTVSKQQARRKGTVLPSVGLRVLAALEQVGRWAGACWSEALAMLRFVGESALALLECVLHPGRMRWRSVLFNVRTAGFDALPIVGLLSFLLGVVVAYQSAEQLRRYGANVFIADIIGLSMVREFAPLMTAIIVAGRSGSAYAAQIGTMQVTEEIDAMRTLGMAPQNMLVVPKLVALALAMPLLTVFADIAGLLGGMLMASTQLDVGFTEFLDRLAKAVSITSYLTGIGKAPVFAVIIVLVGCFEGFRTQGGAESVGRQTTRSVVHSIFLVIVADALFSVVFNVLKL